jgi:hypothetical protein
VTAIKNDGPASKSELQVRDKILQVYYMQVLIFQYVSYLMNYCKG